MDERIVFTAVYVVTAATKANFGRRYQKLWLILSPPSAGFATARYMQMLIKNGR